MDGLRRLLALAMTFGTVADPAALVDEAVDAIAPDDTRLRQAGRTFAADVAADAAVALAVDLARAAHALVQLGSRERDACIAVLREFAELASAKQAPVRVETSSEVELLQALRSTAIRTSAGSTVSHSTVVESIVASAAQSIGARYGSLFLIDQSSQELSSRFRYASAFTT